MPNHLPDMKFRFCSSNYTSLMIWKIYEPNYLAYSAPNHDWIFYLLIKINMHLLSLNVRDNKIIQRYAYLTPRTALQLGTLLTWAQHPCYGVPYSKDAAVEWLISNLKLSENQYTRIEGQPKFCRSKQISSDQDTEDTDTDEWLRGLTNCQTLNPKTKY